MQADRTIHESTYREVVEALKAVLAGSKRSSNGRMGDWMVPTMATMEQVDAALATLQGLPKPAQGVKEAQAALEADIQDADDRSVHATVEAACWGEYAVYAHRASNREDWYITVTAPNGMRDYDGYWRASAHKSADEVVAEAIRGAMLFPIVEPTATLQGLSPAQATTIDMLLYCPNCGMQHVDAPDQRTPDWKNEPHRSHLCHYCKTIWRPADIDTNGVEAIKTKGKADTWDAAPAAEFARAAIQGALPRGEEPTCHLCSGSGLTADGRKCWGRNLDGSTHGATPPAAAGAAIQGWQPIETAPKGRTLLVGYTNRAGKWRTVRGHYYLPQTLELGDDYDGDAEDGFAPEGWYEEVENSETINFTDEPPTHWMPLPPPPVSAAMSAPAPQNQEPSNGNSN